MVEKQSKQLKEHTFDLRQENNSNRACLTDNRMRFRKQSHLIDSINQCSQMAASSGGQPVIQRVVTQVELDDEGKIMHVIIRGRPSSIFSGTMGDHTTAYSLQTEALNLQLGGLHLGEAIDALIYLGDTLQILPGIKYLDKAQPDNKIVIKFNEEYEAFGEAITGALEAGENQELCVSWIQIAINRYLSLRELVPFSTVNTKLAGTDNFGKGKGEKKPLALLSMYQQDNNCGISSEMLCVAIIKLFDFAAASHLSSAESIDEANIYSSDLFVDNFPQDGSLIHVIWKQHLMTIELLYPEVYRCIEKDISGMFSKHLNNALSFKLNTILGSVRSIQKQTVSLLSFLKCNLDQTTKRDKRNQLDTLVMVTGNQKKIIRIMAQIARLNQSLDSEDCVQTLQYLEMWNQKVSTECHRYRETMDRAYINDLYKKSMQKIEHPSSRKVLLLIDQFLSGNELQSPQMQEESVDLNSEIEIPPVMDVEDIFPEFEEEGVNPCSLISGSSSLAIQLVLGELATGGFGILDMLSEGRPPSPFSQTMGAHTTAWIVHLDRIRKRVIGCSIEEAYGNIIALSEDVERKANQQVLFEEEEEEEEQSFYSSLFQTMNSYRAVAPSLLALQDFINALLTFYNFIPGVTVDKANTKGRGEGTYRNLLISFEQRRQPRDRSLIRKALRSLFDGDQPSLMYEWHKQYVREAYPYSYAFAFCFSRAVDEGPSAGQLGAITPDEQAELLATISSDVQMEISEEEPNDLSEMEEQESQARAQELEAMHPSIDIEITPNMTEEEILYQMEMGGLRSNCLIESIMEAAGLQQNTLEILRIRMYLRDQGIPYGRLLAATPQLLDYLANVLGLVGRGIIVFYNKESYIDRTSIVGPNPILIVLENHHFRPLLQLNLEQ